MLRTAHRSLFLAGIGAVIALAGILAAKMLATTPAPVAVATAAAAPAQEPEPAPPITIQHGLGWSQDRLQDALGKNWRWSRSGELTIGNNAQFDWFHAQTGGDPEDLHTIGFGVLIDTQLDSDEAVNRKLTMLAEKLPRFTQLERDQAITWIANCFTDLSKGKATFMLIRNGYAIGLKFSPLPEHITVALIIKRAP